MTTGQLTISPEMVRRCFSKRAADSHKGTYGTVLSVCGSYGMAGAALLAGTAVLRSGAGLLVSALPRSIYAAFTSALPEAVCLPLPETEDGRVSVAALPPLRKRLQAADALLCGCGLGTGDDPDAVMTELLQEAECPIVLDADGINLLAKHIDTLKTICAPLCLTPHPGEMARLTGKTVAAVQASRVETARDLAEAFGVTVVLKGHRTVVASPGCVTLLNPTGTPGMATGGSGDVLAGMIASFAAQGMPLPEAAMCGVYLHGLAGEKAASVFSQHAMLPSDLIRCLSKLFLDFE